MGAISFDVNFFTFAILAANLALGLYSAISNHRKVASEELTAVRNEHNARFDKLERVLVDHSERLAKLEEQRITHKDLAEVYQEMKALSHKWHGEVKAITDKLSDVSGNLLGVKERLELVEQHMNRMDTFLRNHD